MIIDTDIGFDPDDLFTLLLAFNSPEVDVALIVTADEIDSKRAKFVRTILKVCHKENIPIVCGARLKNNYFVVEKLLEETNIKFNDDYIDAIKKIVDENDDVIYLGIGGFTNLANFYKKYPDYRDKFDVFVMGGAVNYSREEKYGEEWIEHNIKVDKASARFFIENPPKNLSLVMAQTTFQPEYEVGENHPFFKKLKNSSNPAHAILIKHLELFNQKGYPWSKMHDPLTFATAIGKDFVTLHKSTISIDQNGTMKLDSFGKEMYWSDPESKKNEFMNFLDSRLFP